MSAPETAPPAHARWLAYMPVDQIVPAETNPKQHSIEDLKASMARWGFTDPPELDERTGRLVAGHGRLETILELAAAQAAGIDPPEGVETDAEGRWCIPVVRGWSSANDDEAAAYLLAANVLPEKGGWDIEGRNTLLTQLAAGPGLAGIGYSAAELADLLAASAAHHGGPSGDTPNPDDEPAALPPAVPVTERGDLWLLGPHRLLCGDSRDPADVETLMAGQPIHLAFTSPPYADRRKYDETSGFEPIPPERYVDWFEPVAANVAAHLAADGSWFVNIKAGGEGLDTHLYVLDLVAAHVREWGWHFATEFCWERGGMPQQVVRRFKNGFEPIYQFARGEWKIRPGAVTTASDHVPIPIGAGAGDTSWSPKTTLSNANAQGSQGFEW